MVFPEGEHEKILRACQILLDEKIAVPILLGTAERDPAQGGRAGLAPERRRDRRSRDGSARGRSTSTSIYRLRQRRGVTLGAADELMNDRNIFGSMMVRMGDADALVAGLTRTIPTPSARRCR